MSAARPLIGWYVHHHGAGHRTRFSAIRPHLDADVVVFSSLAPGPVLPASTIWTRLDSDSLPERAASGALLDPAESDPTAGGALHWAPLKHNGHASRLGMIAAALASQRFDAFVIDVSVEVSLLVRLFGVSTVLMTQPGERDDAPHQLAFSAATCILAPWPDQLYIPRALGPFRTRTRFVGGISRFDGRTPVDEPAAAPVRVPGSVLVLGAGGGAAVTAAEVEAAAAATADTSAWHALGLPATDHVTSSGWSDDPFELLSSAEVVVSFAGQNAVADLAAAGARAIVVAQPRPFGEQEATAAALQKSGLAIGLPAWPAAAEWNGLLARARSTTPDWSRWNTSGAATRAAAAIAAVAGSQPGRPHAATAAPGVADEARAQDATTADAPAASAQPVAVVTLFSAARLDHALNQFALISGSTPLPVVVGVWLDESEPPSIRGVSIIRVPPAPAGLRLAAGRNAGAAEALRLLADTAGSSGTGVGTVQGDAAGGSDSSAPVLVFLDADCLPGPGLLERYRAAAAEHPGSVLCGPVTYLPEGSVPVTSDDFSAVTAPHGARPDLPLGSSRAATDDEYRLFWSLSFACDAEAWHRAGGFDEAYEGYGAEDTDFARRLQQHSVELHWVGGAHAYHQWHPTSSPPWQHLDDILRNGSLYNDRWGHWPMEGWLAAFQEAGAIEWMHGSWCRVDAGLATDRNT